MNQHGASLTWSHLPAHPFDVDGERRWRVLDAQLRRIRSWSAALQYIEEFLSAYDIGSRDRGGRVDSGGDDRDACERRGIVDGT